ncbi:twin-arginine translocase subunit TatC [Microbacteriaceae bacterium 4G12]
MSLGQHLLELRKRLFIAGIAVVLAAIIGWFLSDYILNALRNPILEVGQDQGRNATLNYQTVTSAFDLKLQISLYAGIIISSPVWLYQIFAFLVPGLTRKEKRYTFGFFFSAVPLFLAGCVAGWWVLPHIVELLTRFAGAQDSSLITAKDYFDFVLKLVLAVGVAFVLPAFLVLFNAMGILSGSSIIRSWRMAILAITVFTAIATPAADVMSMFLLAIPMVLLYLLAAGIALLNDKRRARKVKSFEAEYGLS